MVLCDWARSFSFGMDVFASGDTGCKSFGAARGDESGDVRAGCAEDKMMETFPSESVILMFVAPDIYDFLLSRGEFKGEDCVQTDTDGIGGLCSSPCENGAI